uniref:Sorting nexin-17 n=1 Tax=Cacopsylla melanoneura TaxID=428564 RepID=A0A8D8VG92_9HEMI
MHFSIPDTQQLSDDSGKYTGYNLHLNGEYHCTLRYKQLHNFNEQLRKLYGSENVPLFPPKKLFPLSMVQIDERRAHLEKYMQSVAQSNLLRNCEVVVSFLQLAQQESYGEEIHDVSLDIYLMNNVQTTISVSSNDSYTVVLERVCNELCLPNTYTYYFALFLVSCSNDNHLSIIRKLQPYECPYISQKTIPGSLRLYLMKNYWDLDYDLELMTDPVGLGILYAQAVSDVRRECIVVHQDTRTILNQLEASGAKKEYVDLARKLKYYGFLEFEPCTCDFPKPNTRVVVNIGMREINFRIRSTDGEIREGTFKVTRMRCWKITINKEEDTNDMNGVDGSHHNASSSTTQLAFEYLLAKNKLQWITIQSEQAILMSNLLQSIIDELVLKKSHQEDDSRSGRLSNGNSFYYMKRDGSSQITSPSISSTELDSNSSNGSNESRNSLGRRSSSKLSAVGMRVMGKSPFVENDAFEGIGDDDL